MTNVIRRATQEPGQVLEDLAGNLWLSRAIYATAELGIADALPDGEPVAVADLAAATDTDADALHRVLRALAANGFFAAAGDRTYVHTDLSRAMRADSPMSLRNLMLLGASDWTWACWGRIADSVRSGRPAFELVYGKDLWSYFSEDDPAAAEVFQRAMTDLAAATDGPLADALDIAGARTVVDVGGGHGTLLAAVADRHPGVEPVLFESEEMLRTLSTDPRTADHAARFTLRAGDAVQAVDCEADLYLLKQVLHMVDDPTAIRVLRNCAASARPGARIVAIERLVRDVPDAAFTKLIDLHMLAIATDGGRERTEAEFADLFARADLRFAGSKPTTPPTGMYLIEATV